MNIASLSHVAAASIAGTDRAASSEVTKAARSDSHGPPGGSGMVEKTEQVIKGDPAGDSTADGRQLLDTFERRHSEDDESSHEENQDMGADALPLDLQKSLADDPPPVHFDVQV